MTMNILNFITIPMISFVNELTEVEARQYSDLWFWGIMIQYFFAIIYLLELGWKLYAYGIRRFFIHTPFIIKSEVIF